MADLNEQSREERIDELIKRIVRNRDGEALSGLNSMGISVEFTDEGVRWRDMKVKEGDPDVEYIGDKPKFKGLTVKVDVDVSEALTGLKALQREAREATKALRELEEQTKSYGEVTEESSMNIADTLVRLAKNSDKSITDDIRRSYE